MAEVNYKDDEFANDEEVFVVGSNKDKPKDDIEIEVVDDTPEQDRGKTPLKEEAVQQENAQEEEMDRVASDSVQKRMNQLTHRYHDERRAREALERQNQEAIQLAQAVLADYERIQKAYEAGGEFTRKQWEDKISYAQRFADDKFRKAYEAGDTEGLLEAQKIRDEVALERARLENANFALPQQNALQTERQPVYNQPTVEPQRPQAPQRDERAEDWAAKNPWFGADEEMTSLAYGLHSKLVKTGIDPTSDEYYATIDKRMRDVFPDYFGKPKEKPKASSPVAPAGRTTAGKKMTLTATQVALAKKLGVSLEQYAKHVAKLQEQANG
jgi:hypothetical protein